MRWDNVLERWFPLQDLAHLWVFGLILPCMEFAARNAKIGSLMPISITRIKGSEIPVRIWDRFASTALIEDKGRTIR